MHMSIIQKNGNHSLVRLIRYIFILYLFGVKNINTVIYIFSHILDALTQPAPKITFFYETEVAYHNDTFRFSTLHGSLIFID